MSGEASDLVWPTQATQVRLDEHEREELEGALNAFWQGDDDSDGVAGTVEQHIVWSFIERLHAHLLSDSVRRLMAQEYLIDRGDYHGQDLTRHAQAMAAAVRAAFSQPRNTPTPEADQ